MTTTDPPLTLSDEQASALRGALLSWHWTVWDCPEEKLHDPYTYGFYRDLTADDVDTFLAEATASPSVVVDESDTTIGSGIPVRWCNGNQRRLQAAADAMLEVTRPDGTPLLPGRGWAAVLAREALWAADRAHRDETDPTDG